MRIATPLFPILGAAAFLLAGCSSPQPVIPAAISNPQAEVQAALAGVCSGRGVSEAAAYAGGGVHPVVLLASTGQVHDWSDDLSGMWVPQSVQDAQLVACVDPEQERSIEVCPYNGPDITRYRYEVSLRLVEARTGATVASTVLEGNDPRECRQTEDYDLTRLAGDHISYSAAADWMRAHVETASVSGSTAPQQAGTGPGEPSSEASFVGEWQATDSYDGSAMRLTISGDAGGGYSVTWYDDYWSLCQGPATVETSGSADTNDPNTLHTYWQVECTVAGQVGDFAADFVYSEAGDTLEQIYEEGIRETWNRASGPWLVGEWQATDSYDGSAMRLTITGDGGDGYSASWYDDYWSMCEGPATVETSGRVDANDPNALHTVWHVECTVPGQVSDFAADFVYRAASDTLEQIYEDGTRDTWYRSSGP